MTVLVGIYCKDGVVIGSDSAATFAAGQTRTIEQRTKKIDIVDDQVIVACTGEIGLGQRFHAIVSRMRADQAFTKEPIEVGKALTTAMVQDFGSTGAQPNLGALVAFPCKGGFHLCEFAPGTLQPEQKTERLWYVSMGSGQAIADPFLGFLREALWDDGPPTHQEAVFAVTWTLMQAIKLNPGGINEPIQMAVLSYVKGKLVAREYSEDEIAEHRENVEGAMRHVREYRQVLRGKGNAVIPDTPAPPP